ncbi:MAG: DMT family transporter [Thermoplasmata archaeon]|nr:DMT family transporter [Thermoplasmata archaeon]
MDPRHRDYALVLLASVLWGTSFPGSKLTVDSVDPLFLTFARMGLGALLGFAVLLVLRRADLRLFREPIVWVLGAVNAVAFDLQNEGILWTTASKTALVVNVNVVFIAIVMVLFFHEVMTRSKVVGILIGLLGVVVLATKLDPATLQGGQFAGDVMVFFAGVVWTFYVVGVKKMVDRGTDAIALAAAMLATTSVLSTIPLFFLGWPLPRNDAGWLGILYLGLVPTFPPLLLFVHSMKTISPTISSLLILLEVVVAAILSFLIFQDKLDAYTLAGGALILFGAYVVTRGERSLPEVAATGFAPVPAEPTSREPDGPIER